MSTRAPVGRALVTVAWLLAVGATLLNGLVVGYGAIWFQLFGDSPDREDYQVSAGGYAAAAVVLALAVPALLTHRGPRRVAPVACVAAVLLGLLALTSAVRAAGHEQEGAAVSTVWDGVGGVVWAPWTWVLVVLGLHGLLLLGAGRVRRTGATSA
jgi:hypothetical protein